MSSASVTGSFKRVAHERQVALEQLVLQRLGAGGHDHLAAVEQRRHEIGEGLAGAGAGFGDQRAAPRDRLGDGFGHRELLRAKTKSREGAGQDAAFAQDRGELAIGGLLAGVGIGGERGAAQVALLGRAGAFAGLAALPLSAVAALPLAAVLAALPLSAAKHGADGSRALAEDLVGLRDARLVLLVGLAGNPLELGERLEPELLQRAEAVDGLRASAWPPCSAAW